MYETMELLLKTPEKIGIITTLGTVSVMLFLISNPLTLGDVLLIIWFSYVLGFTIVGKAFEKGYFKSNPAEAEKVDLMVDAYNKAETISWTMAGFALTALTFIITIFSSSLANIELLIVFFSLAFIAEIVSAFLYHDLTKGVSAYTGVVFQYAGMLAILSGFFTYLLSNLSWSGYLWLVYSVGLISFIALTARELSFFVTYWKALANEHSRKDRE